MKAASVWGLGLLGFTLIVVAFIGWSHMMGTGSSMTVDDARNWALAWGAPGFAISFLALIVWSKNETASK